MTLYYTYYKISWSCIIEKGHVIKKNETTRAKNYKKYYHVVY